MSNKNTLPMNDEELQKDGEEKRETPMQPPHLWTVDTIVVNGQPIAVTFPLEES